MRSSITQLPEQALLVVLDEITDPHNFGAIVRSAVAFGAHGIITLKHRAAPVTPVVVRASAGATEHARIARVSNLVQALDVLQKHDFDVIGLAVEGAEDLPRYTSSSERSRVARHRLRGPRLAQARARALHAASAHPDGWPD